MNRKWVQVKVGGVYHYDVRGMMSSLHKGTKTVRVFGLQERQGSNPLAEVVSVQTGECFSTDSAWLQPDPALLKRKFITLRHYCKTRCPDLLFTHHHLFEKAHRQYVIVSVRPATNHVTALDKDGILHTFDVSHTKYKMERNAGYDARVEQEYEEYAGLWYDDPFEDDGIKGSTYDSYRWDSDMEDYV